MQLMQLSAYTESDTCSSTLEVEMDLDLAPYEEDSGEDTVPVPMSRDDAVWEAKERARLGNCEAAGFWLMVAGELP